MSTSASVVKYNSGGGLRGANNGAEEEWVTTKKVDIVTTKVMSFVLSSIIPVFCQGLD